MDINGFEPLLRDATVKAIDGVGRKLAGATVTTESAVVRLLKRWNALDRQEKETVANVIIAAAITAVSAIGALRRRKKKGVRRVAKKLAG